MPAVKEEEKPAANEVADKIKCMPCKLEEADDKIVLKKELAAEQEAIAEPEVVVTPTNKVTISSKYDNTPTKMSPGLKQRMTFRKIASSENFTPINKVQKARDVEEFLAERMKTVSPTQQLKMKENELKEVPKIVIKPPPGLCIDDNADQICSDQSSAGDDASKLEPCLRYNRGRCYAKPGTCKFGHFC